MTSATVKTPPQVFHVNTERELSLASAIIANLKPSTAKPWVITISQDDEHRSLKQNRLSFAWYKFRGKENGNGVYHERAFCKLTYGVPILREEKSFEKFYCTTLAPLTYEQQLDAMEFVPVTRLMGVKQFAEYLNEVEQQSAIQGIILPRPKDLYWDALMKEADK
jgi:hypothetical protein